MSISHVIRLRKYICFWNFTHTHFLSLSHTHARTHTHTHTYIYIYICVCVCVCVCVCFMGVRFNLKTTRQVNIIQFLLLTLLNQRDIFKGSGRTHALCLTFIIYGPILQNFWSQNIYQCTLYFIAYSIFRRASSWIFSVENKKQICLLVLTKRLKDDSRPLESHRIFCLDREPASTLKEKPNIWRQINEI